MIWIMIQQRHTRKTPNRSTKKPTNFTQFCPRTLMKLLHDQCVMKLYNQKYCRNVQRNQYLPAAMTSVQSHYKPQVLACSRNRRAYLYSNTPSHLDQNRLCKNHLMRRHQFFPLNASIIKEFLGLFLTVQGSSLCSLVSQTGIFPYQRGVSSFQCRFLDRAKYLIGPLGTQNWHRKHSGHALFTVVTAGNMGMRARRQSKQDRRGQT